MVQADYQEGAAAYDSDWGHDSTDIPGMHHTWTSTRRARGSHGKLCFTTAPAVEMQ